MEPLLAAFRLFVDAVGEREACKRLGKVVHKDGRPLTLRTLRQWYRTGVTPRYRTRVQATIAARGRAVKARETAQKLGPSWSPEDIRTPPENKTGEDLGREERLPRIHPRRDGSTRNRRSRYSTTRWTPLPPNTRFRGIYRWFDVDLQYDGASEEAIKQHMANVLMREWKGSGYRACRLVIWAGTVIADNKHYLEDPQLFSFIDRAHEWRNFHVSTKPRITERGVEDAPWTAATHVSAELLGGDGATMRWSMEQQSKVRVVWVHMFKVELFDIEDRAPRSPRPPRRRPVQEPAWDPDVTIV